jgi:hypothetical protein
MRDLNQENKSKRLFKKSGNRESEKPFPGSPGVLRPFRMKTHQRAETNFGLRISAFFRVSAFGFE